MTNSNVLRADEHACTDYDSMYTHMPEVQRDVMRMLCTRQSETIGKTSQWYGKI